MKKTLAITLFSVFFCLGFFGYSFFGKYLFHTHNNQATLYWYDIYKTPEDTELWINPLKQAFLKHGYILETQDKHPIETSEIVILVHPKLPPLQTIRTKRLYIWTLESPLSRPQPLPENIQEAAKKIFTWRRDLVDNQKVFYLPVFSRISGPTFIKTDLSHKNILLTQVAQNIYFYHALYEERRQAVKWFIENHPDDFIFYGLFWDKLKKDIAPEKHLDFDARYKHFTPHKIETLQSAKFALAYENIAHTDYVSEKIYDVMRAGTVPVYLGAPNITDYVPENCFIDKRQFKTYNELYAFLKNMPDTVYLDYLKCIQTFLTSDSINALTANNTVSRLTQEIFEEE